MESEPRWPALVALFAVAGLRFTLPAWMSVGPDWAFTLVLILVMIPVVVFHRTGRHSENQIAGHLATGIVTADMVVSLVLLIARLPAHKESPQQLLLAAGGLWISNVLVFASWYWRLDGGGPNARDRREHHETGAFLFPQMTLKKPEQHGWTPGFVDYLFLAFNTSTAFSPTDVPVLSRWAKLMMMVQSAIALATIVLLAARAVNVL